MSSTGLIGLAAAAVAIAVMAGCVGNGARFLGKERPISAVTGKWAIVVHGGAGMLDKDMSEEMKAAYRAGLTTAIDAGKRVLASGGSSLDAVEAAVRTFEDNELFNAGKGAVLTRAGTCELDASIMEGRTLKCGAVAGAKTVQHPISFARQIMERTPHILFTGEGAERLAGELGVERVDPAYFITPRRKEQLERKMKEMGLVRADGGGQRPELGEASPDGAMGTVGCVALDVHGNIAAATSTGGMTAKMPGRVGDSPIIGAGCYANNASLGVSCTGTGEQYIRHVAAHELSALVRYKGLSLDEAARVVLNDRLDPDDGGLIAIGRDGTIVMMMTTGCMPRAAADSGGRFEISIWDEVK
jgi:beta-aspartyl-peptidase (threonine type)